MLKINTFVLTGVLSVSALWVGLSSSDSMAAQQPFWQASSTISSEWMFNKEGMEEKGDKAEKDRREHPPKEGGKDGKKPKGPPQEAVDACKGKSEGESCSFENKRGKVEGVCKTRHETVSCVPEKKSKSKPEKDKPQPDKN